MKENVLKNKLTKNIFRSTLCDFRADLFLICRARSRVWQKNHLAQFSFWRRSCQNCIINEHWSYKNPWISSRAKRPAHFKAHWSTRTWMNECRMGKYNLNGAAHRITCCTATRHTDFISPPLVLTPMHCFIIIFLTPCHKRPLNPLTRKRDRDRTTIRRVIEWATGARNAIERAARKTH